ncbi:MAG TPA: hemerythrin domain-containing protein [Acidimicrobiales bacterium]|nr:hemerythrin domain-containing protein [Acidimicrobiales bacterium]
MTTIQLPTANFADGIDLVDANAYDFYRQIHKAIRYALFHTTLRAGSLDAADTDAVDGFLEAQRSLLGLLHSHHHHEDLFIQPMLEEHAAGLARVIAGQHGDVEDGMACLAQRADRLGTVARPGRAAAAHNLYLDLSRVTSAYLAHQLVEETQVMPALRAVMPTEELVAVDLAIRGSLPPHEMAEVITYMLPAMDVEERTEMLSGLAMAPPEIFAMFRAAAKAALPANQWAQLAQRVGIS